MSFCLISKNLPRHKTELPALCSLSAHSHWGVNANVLRVVNTTVFLLPGPLPLSLIQIPSHPNHNSRPTTEANGLEAPTSPSRTQKLIKCPKGASQSSFPAFGDLKPEGLTVLLSGYKSLKMCL